MKWGVLFLTALLSGCSAPLFGAALFMIAYQQEQAVGGSSPAPGPWLDVSRPPPELAPDRRINEQDCTKPIDWSQGNLRCK